MMRVSVLVLIVVAGCLPWCVAEASVDAPASPSASPSPAPSAPALPPPAAPKPAYYGHYILAHDLVALSLLFAGIYGADLGGMTFVGLITWPYVPATIHALNGRAGAAVASGAVRVGLPIVAAIIGWNMAPPESDSGDFGGPCGFFGCKADYAGRGILVGLVVAAVGDQLVALLNSNLVEGPSTWERLSPSTPPETPRRSPRRSSQWTMRSIVPTLATDGRSVGAALVGRY